MTKTFTRNPFIKADKDLPGHSTKHYREDYKKFLNHEVTIKQINHRLGGIEEFYTHTEGLVTDLYIDFLVIERTDMSDNGRKLYITFKYADFLKNDYQIELK